MLECGSRQGSRGYKEPASSRRREIRQVSQQIGQTRWVPWIVGQPMSRQIQGERLDLELACNLEWQ